MTHDIITAVLMLVSAGSAGWAGYQFWYWRKELEFACSGDQKHRVAVHEAGHAICVLRCEKVVQTTLKKVSTVPDAQYGGYCDYKYKGEGWPAAWEHLVVSMAGPAGELLARETVSLGGCQGDLTHALKLANEIAHVVPDVADLDGSMNHLHLINAWFPERPSEPAKRVLSLGLWTAIDRISKNERAFYRLADALVDRRELTGNQIGKLLEGL